MAYKIEVHMAVMKDGERVKEWRAVHPVGRPGTTEPYRFENKAAAEKTLRRICEPFNRDQYRIVEAP